MTKIRDNLQTIGAKLDEFSRQYHDKHHKVKLLAVSKRHSIEKIREAYDYGQRAFGENYVQELLEKSIALKDLNIEWHFIGPLQSNKTQKIAAVASWVHTIDRLKIAQRLNDQRPEHLPPLSICIQVNISGEESKSGVKKEQLIDLAKQIILLPNIKLRGIMVIPAPENDFEKQRQVFSEVLKIKQNVQQALEDSDVELDTLSMGMSNDMQAAIAEGATIVRIGTAIFGTRID